MEPHLVVTEVRQNGVDLRSGHKECALQNIEPLEKVVVATVAPGPRTSAPSAMKGECCSQDLKAIAVQNHPRRSSDVGLQTAQYE